MVRINGAMVFLIGDFIAQSIPTISPVNQLISSGSKPPLSRNNQEPTLRLAGSHVPSCPNMASKVWQVGVLLGKQHQGPKLYLCWV